MSTLHKSKKMRSPNTCAPRNFRLYQFIVSYERCQNAKSIRDIVTGQMKHKEPTGQLQDNYEI